MTGRSLRRFDVGETWTPDALPTSVRRAATVALSVLGVLVGWQALVLATGLPTVVLPSPAAVARAFGENWAAIRANLAYTGLEIALGWVTGVGVGVALAVAMAASTRLRLVLYPYLVAVRIVPLIVAAPVLIVVLGPTPPTRVLMAAVLAFFPVTVATLDGLRSVPEEQVALLRSVGTPDWKLFAFVRVPNAVPGLFAGLQIATPLAIEGVVLAEFLAASRGAGHAILVAASRLETPLLFAYVFALVAVGVAVFGAVTLLDALVPWSGGSDPFGADRLRSGDRLDGSPGIPTVVIGAIAAIAFGGAWHVGSLAASNLRLFVPTPIEVVAVVESSPGLLVVATVATLRKLVVGWTVGAGAGFVLGAVIVFVPRLRVPVYTYLAGVRVLPVVVFAPLLLVWFGVSFASGAVLVALSTFFPVAIGTATGLDRLPRGYRDLLGLVDAPTRAALRVRFRYGVPELLAGVKLSVLTGLSGVVVAEWFVATDGLGVLVLQQTRTFQADLAVAAIGALFVVGGVLFGLVSMLQQRLLW